MSKAFLIAPLSSSAGEKELAEVYVRYAHAVTDEKKEKLRRRVDRRAQNKDKDRHHDETAAPFSETDSERIHADTPPQTLMYSGCPPGPYSSIPEMTPFQNFDIMTSSLYPLETFLSSVCNWEEIANGV